METNNAKIGSFTVTGDWLAQSKQLKKKFSQLSDSDLKFEPGKEEELLKRLESKLHKKRDQVISILNQNVA